MQNRLPEGSLSNDVADDVSIVEQLILLDDVIVVLVIPPYCHAQMAVVVRGLEQWQ